MSRNAKLIVAAVCLVSALGASSASAMRGVLGAGLGTVNGVGSPIGDRNTSSQLFTLNGFGLLGVNPWLGVMADISIGLPRSYNGAVSGGETQKVELKAFFFDALAGVYKTYSDGGFFYLGLGFTVATADREDTVADSGGVEIFKSDPGTSLGVVFGANIGLPIKDDIFGFLSLRQRFVTADVEKTGPNFRSTQDVSLGGLEVSAGVAFGIGL